VVEKRGHGRPRGSKNKPKDASMVVSSSSAPVKWRPGHPLGRINQNLLLFLRANLRMQALRAMVLLFLLLPMCSLFSLSLVLNTMSSSMFL
jgi:hypothetical protein